MVLLLSASCSRCRVFSWYSGCHRVVAGLGFSPSTPVVSEWWQVWGFLLVLRLSASCGRSGVFSWYSGCQRVVAGLEFSPGTPVSTATIK